MNKLTLFFDFLADPDRKSLFQVSKDLHTLKDLSLKDKLYTYFGSLMYKKDAGNISDYLPFSAYLKIRREYYRSEGKHPILQNKNSFIPFMAEKGFPVPKNLGRFDKGLLIAKEEQRILSDPEKIHRQLQAWTDKYQAIFIKRVDSEGGEDVFRIKQGDSLTLSTIKNHEYIIEAQLNQHKSLQAINPNCINTLRVMSVLDKETGAVFIPDSFLRMGVGKSHVDNGSSGGLFVHYDLYSNQMSSVAYRLPEHGGASFYRHPTTDYIFKNGTLPFPQKIIGLVDKAAKCFPETELIGWDIAYTPEKPVIIEGNDNPHIVMMQISAGGLWNNPIYKKAFSPYIN